MSLDITLTADEKVFDLNITHNCNEMADFMGVYKEIWRPEELGITRAYEVKSALERSIAYLQTHDITHLEPDNKWGTQDQFLGFLYEYLDLVNRYPNARIEADR